MNTHKLTATIKGTDQEVEVIGFHGGAHRMARMVTCKDASGNIADIHLSQLEGFSGSLKVRGGDSVNVLKAVQDHPHDWVEKQNGDIIISFFGKEVSA